MSLPVLAILVVVGVTMVVAAVHLTGGSTRARLTGLGAVKQHVLAMSELQDIDWHAVCEDQSAAFAKDRDGRLALALVTGKHVTVHEIGAGDVAACRVVSSRTGKAVIMKLADLAWPQMTFQFADASDADAIAAALNERLKRPEQRKTAA